LYRLNKRLISQSHSISLSHRYQLNENIMTIRMLFPLAIIEGVGCALCFVVVLYRLNRLEHYGVKDDVQLICVEVRVHVLIEPLAKLQIPWNI
jgi:hypothetical protein